MTHQNWYIPEPAPDKRRPNMLVYSSCHTAGILRYLNEHRKGERNRYNLSAVIVHKAAEDPTALTNPVLRYAFGTADVILHHPLASEKWAGFRTEEIGHKASARIVSMESPQASCFWPIAEYGGKWPIEKAASLGADLTEILALFDDGRLPMGFGYRFAEDVTRMFDREKFSRTDLHAAEFVAKYFRDQKLFFTFNHPTLPVLGYMIDQFLGLLGHEMRGPDHALRLPLATEPGENYYPETHYEFEHYGFTYPKRWPHAMGGMQFYRDRIRLFYENLMQSAGSNPA